MRRLNIYFMHSSKLDYNNLIYKKVLSSSVCLNHNIILPMSNEYKEKYRKDLIDMADLVIVELSNPSLGLVLELRWLQKASKNKLFLCFDKDIPKMVKKYVNDVKFVSTDNYLKTVEEFITVAAKDEADRAQEGSAVTLGEL